MNLLSRTAVAAAAAVALTVPTAAITTATAAPTAAQADQHSQVVAKKAKKKKVKVALKRSAAYSHAGQAGVKVTAVVTKGKKKLKGKVVFSLNGAAVRTAKLKKGQASYRLSSSNTPGTYTVTAKYKGKKKSTSIRVYSSAISLSGTAFTISAATPSYQLPELTGTVQYKDAPAKDGYVDIYQNGNVKGGSSSPDYCCMASVDGAGAFRFGGSTFLAKVQAKGPGTYSYQAFYTAGYAFADYIYSTPITVTVTP